MQEGVHFLLGLRRAGRVSTACDKGRDTGGEGRERGGRGGRGTEGPPMFIITTAVGGLEVAIPLIALWKGCQEWSRGCLASKRKHAVDRLCVSVARASLSSV